MAQPDPTLPDPGSGLIFHVEAVHPPTQYVRVILSRAMALKVIEALEDAPDARLNAFLGELSAALQ